MSSDDFPPLRARGTAVTAPTNPKPVPHPLDSDWDVSIDDQVYGPFRGHDLESLINEGRVEYDTLVRRSGSAQDNWIKASNDRALRKFFMPTAQSRPAPQPSISAGSGA